MAVLILTRFKPFMVNYKKWLYAFNEQLIIFTPKKHEESYKKEGYDLVIGFDDFDNDNLIFFHANTLFNTMGFNNIIALDERDIIRAALLRQEYNLPGQKVSSAIAYRNKLIMKTFLQKQNISVPPFAPVHSLFDIFNFTKKHNYPIVLKPVEGMGGQNTYVIYSDNDLLDVLQNNHLKNYMIEKYMNCSMGTFDGVVVRNKIIFSSSCLYFKPRLKYHEPLSLSILSENDALFNKLKKYGERVINALPPMETSVFHCEIFIDGENLLLCECASRSPGGKIDECISQSYGINMNEFVCKSLFTENYPSAFSFKEYTGSIMIPKKEGILKKIPSKYPYDWITEIENRFSCGDKLEPTKLNGDVLMTLVVKGTSSSEIKDRCAQVINFINQNVIID